MKNLDLQLLKRISSIEGKRSGKPCIIGTRITIYDIFSYFASEMTLKQILDDFPNIKEEDIYACFAYVLINHDIID